MQKTATRTLVLGSIAVAAVTLAASSEPDFSAERFKAHVTFLADDLLEGREAGTRGHEIAARYVASEFAQLGLKPGGTNGTYFEEVDLLEASNTGARPTLKISTPHGARTLRVGETAIVRGPLNGGTAHVTAPLVFVGYGMKDDAVGYDDYAGLDVHGKIAVVLWGSPKGMDSEIGAHLRSEQGRVAADHGALATITLMTRGTATAFPWPKVLEFAGEPRTTWVRKDGAPFDPNDGLKATGLIAPTEAAAVFDGAPHSLDQILDEADKNGGRPKGFALKTSADISATTTVRRYRSPDVVGIIEGSDPSLKNEYVALMAHADHIGINPNGTGDRINNGALDNASGVATLLEVARAFTAGADGPRRSVLVVANTAEEKGLLGAEYLAHYPPVAIDRLTAAVDLDMPLLLYDFTDVVAYGAGHSTLEGVFRKAAGSMGVKLSPDPMPEQAIFTRSDHYAMVKVGVPAVMLATGMANGGEAAWSKFLANNYHQPSDDLSQPIVWSAGAKFAELNYRVVRALADAEERAHWYTGDYFGNLFAADAAKVPKPTSSQ